MRLRDATALAELLRANPALRVTGAARPGACLHPRANLALAGAEPTPLPGSALERPASLSAAARSHLLPEQRLQVEIVEVLRPEVEARGGKLLALNGELPSASKNNPQDRSRMSRAQAVRTAMGYEAGTPDLEVVSRSGRAHFLELKRARGDADLLGHRKARGELSREQRAFRDWCLDHRVAWACVRSVEEARAALVEWGCLA